MQWGFSYENILWNFQITKSYKELKCFEILENPRCTDLQLTIKPLSFKNTYVIETELSDFHRMVVSVIKTHFTKMKPQFVRRWKYKGFHNETFLDSLRHELNIQGSGF